MIAVDPGMSSSPSVSSTGDPPAAQDSGFWPRLLYRWFVEYNPLYLVSAALVLGGCILWSKGLVQQESLAGPLGVAFVAELYALALVCGAAILTRIGLRRPAVMLALIFVIYQWDTTLHTETCAYLGWVGRMAAACWLLLFAGKLYALGWALRLRFDRRLVIAALTAAAGLALAPHVLPGLGGRSAAALVATWVFAVGALYRREAIVSKIELDAWGRTVLRRATHAAWALSGALLGLHVLVWCRDHDVSLAPLLFAAPLLTLRCVRSEARMWATVLTTLVLAAQARPDAFFATSFLAAAALCLRALAPTFAPTPGPAQPDAEPHPGAGPYRTGAVAREAQVHSYPGVAPAVVGERERQRSLVGALFGTYLAVWTVHWSHGPWPPHMVGLDAALGLLVALVVWRTRLRSPLVPLLVCYGHLVVERRLVPVPASAVSMGETLVALGFALLVGSLVTSYRFAPPAGEPPRHHRSRLQGVP